MLNNTVFKFCVARTNGINLNCATANVSGFFIFLFPFMLKCLKRIVYTHCLQIPSSHSYHISLSLSFPSLSVLSLSVSQGFLSLSLSLGMALFIAVAFPQPPFWRRFLWLWYVFVSLWVSLV